MKFFIYVIILSFFCGCTDPNSAEKLLKAQAYENIVFTGYDFLGCSSDDVFRTGFAATSISGDYVTGVVCRGYFKGGTIRIHEAN